MDKPRTVRIHPSDNVVVATEPLPAGDEITVGEQRLVLSHDVPPVKSVGYSMPSVALLQTGSTIVRWPYGYAPNISPY